jgi:hypothetical protein
MALLSLGFKDSLIYVRVAEIQWQLQIFLNSLMKKLGTACYGV